MTTTITKTMTFSRIAFVVASLTALGCGNSTTQTDGGNNPDLSGPNTNPDLSGPNNFPAAPTIGVQIDRLGRPGVNTALTNPFWDSKGDGTGKAAHQAIQDAYNQASDPTMWATQFGTEIKKSLGVYDALDTDINHASACGNQIGFGALSMADYTVMGNIVLPDDQLYVDTSSGVCNQYLGVELNVLNVHNTDCGGRTPLYNTIDITYAALTDAALALATPVANFNGVPVDEDGTASISAFPFLATPIQ